MQRFFISAILIFTINACSTHKSEEKPKNEMPKALQDKNSSFESVSKRSYDDLLENIYSEIVSNDTTLRNLEDKIEDLNTSKSDTTELFDKFNTKNQSYFSSADRHASDIRDSVLREKTKDLISMQLSKYNARIGRHNTLLKIINAKQVAVSDLHNVLKIVRTLPLIDKYQKDNLPNIKSFEGYIKQQDAAIKFADTLLKK